MHMFQSEYWRPPVQNGQNGRRASKVSPKWTDDPLDLTERGHGITQHVTRDCFSWRLCKRVGLVFVSTVLLLFLLQPARRYHQITRTTVLAPSTPNLTETDVASANWSSFAYAQYATDETYLCNSAAIFSSLRRLNTKASLLLLYPSKWSPRHARQHDSRIARTLRLLRDEYFVDLQPITPLYLGDQSTWVESFTKLIAFNQTQYSRLLHLDSDATVLQNLDHLFLLPPTRIALPRAYWLSNTLSSQLMLIQPSTTEFAKILSAVYTKRKDEYDMDIINKLYANNSMILPHRGYDLITGEFRNGKNEHVQYLGSADEEWHAAKVLEEAKYVHFSDWPHPKPWITVVNETIKAMAPECSVQTNGREDCSDRDAWNWLYDDFRKRREAVCPEIQELPREDIT